MRPPPGRLTPRAEPPAPGAVIHPSLLIENSSCLCPCSAACLSVHEQGRKVGFRRKRTARRLICRRHLALVCVSCWPHAYGYIRYPRVDVLLLNVFAPPFCSTVLMLPCSAGPAVQFAK